MGILLQLASALGGRGDAADLRLTIGLAESGDKSSIQELADNSANKKTAIRSDCIKTLYELGERRPELIVPSTDKFVGLLSSKDNSMVCDAMAALHSIARVDPAGIYAILANVLQAKDKGSAITLDHALSILAEPARYAKYAGEALPLLLVAMQDCPVNQFPAYAEAAQPVVNAEYKPHLEAVVRRRLPELADLPAKAKRVEKVLKKLGKA